MKVRPRGLRLLLSSICLLLFLTTPNSFAQNNHLSLTDTVPTLNLVLTEDYDKKGREFYFSNRRYISACIELLGFDLSDEASPTLHLHVSASARSVAYQHISRWIAGHSKATVTFKISPTLTLKGESKAKYTAPQTIYYSQDAPARQMLKDSPVWRSAGHVACSAISDAIAEAGDSAVPVLAKALEHREWDFRLAAVHALQKTKSALALDPLIDALQDMFHDSFEGGWPVAEAAALALEGVGIAAVDPLVDLLDSPDGELRLRAIKLLHTINIRHTVNNVSMVNKVVSILSDSDPITRKFAAKILDTIGYVPESSSREEIEIEMRYYFSQQDWESLGKMRGGIPSLVNMLVATSLPIEDIRAELVKIGDPAVPYLIDALKPKPNEIRIRIKKEKEMDLGPRKRRLINVAIILGKIGG